MNKKDEALYLRNCHRKRRFINEDEARTAISQIKRVPGTTYAVQVYQCQFCFGFHLRKIRQRRKSFRG